MLAGKIIRQVEIPHEPGEWMRLRMPSGRKLEEARDAKRHRLLEQVREMGPEIYTTLPSQQADGPTDPLVAYDLEVLLRSGIVGWSYSERVRPEDVEDLDETTRRWAAEQLLAMAQETEAERKNG